MSGHEHRSSGVAGIDRIFASQEPTGFRACPACQGIMLPDSLDPHDELVFTDDGELVHARCDR